MNQIYSVPGAPLPGGARGRRLAGLVVVVLALFVVVAIAKPWGVPVPVPPAASPASDSTPMLPTAAPTTGPVTSSQPNPAVPVALPLAFTTPAAPSAAAEWQGLQWRRLAADDPLTLVTSVIRWRGGFVAVGWSGAGNPFTPIWTSTDGTRWDPVPFNTPDTFPTGSLVVGVAAVPKGLVALTETARTCSTAPCTPIYDPPVTAWTSADGRQWVPHAIPAPANPTGGVLKFAGGPGGVVVTSGGLNDSVATTTDGVKWQSQPAGTLPTGFIVNDLLGTPAGYVAAGLQVTNQAGWEAATLWSKDGRHWSDMPILLPPSPAFASPASPVSPASATPNGSNEQTAAVSILAGRDGLIEVGGDFGWPGATIWWRSADGRHWAALPDFTPLGTQACSVKPCRLLPDGWLGGDGQRLVAGGAGTDGGAWTSSDGISWQRISMSGDIPDSDPPVATLLPGGVLLTDGLTTWFGEAVVR